MSLGTYFNLTQYVKNKHNNGENLSIAQKGVCSLSSGVIGSFFGTPTDLVLVRMQADRRAGLEESQR